MVPKELFSKNLPYLRDLQCALKKSEQTVQVEDKRRSGYKLITEELFMKTSYCTEYSRC